MRRFRLLSVVSLVAAAACGRDEITLPATITVNQITVDASAAWAYVDLSTGALVAQTTPTTSTSWDIGFNATSVVVNGGASGPAGVTAYCLCQNGATPTNAAILAMTPESEADDFTNVTVSSIPAASTAWSALTFDASKWYAYDLLGDHRISPTFQVYLLQRGTRVYKLQITNYYGPAGETRRITVRYAKLKD